MRARIVEIFVALASSVQAGIVEMGFVALASLIQALVLEVYFILVFSTFLPFAQVLTSSSDPSSLFSEKNF